MENTPNNIPSEGIDDSHIEARADYILGRLGFSWEDLQGKRILDIGAGSAEFGAAARKRGIEVVSLDRKLLDDEGVAPYQKKRYIQGSGDQLPFADESFDIVVSHASAPYHAHNREHLAQFIKEMRRVLKKGGECRFGPVGMGGGLFPDDDQRELVDNLIISEGGEETGLSVEKEMKSVSLRTTAALRKLIPNVRNSTDDQLAQKDNFYSFTK